MTIFNLNPVQFFGSVAFVCLLSSALILFPSSLCVPVMLAILFFLSKT